MLFDVAELQGSAGSRPPSEASAAVGSRPWIIRGLAPSVLFAILAFWRNQLAGVGNTTFLAPEMVVVWVAGRSGTKSSSDAFLEPSGKILGGVWQHFGLSF